MYFTFLNETLVKINVFSFRINISEEIVIHLYCICIKKYVFILPLVLRRASRTIIWLLYLL